MVMDVQENENAWSSAWEKYCTVEFLLNNL